jgi:carbon-monoxide dehydrogenase small subunit
MKIVVNGDPYDVDAPLLTSLLRVLREELEIPGPKIGCEGGGCGACTVFVNGQPQRSCLTAVGTVDGAEITTIEGLGDADHLSSMQQSFVHHYAAQCGFCTSGMIMAATAYIDGGGATDRESIQEALAGHVCRCTGYQKIIDAVAAASSGDFDLSVTAEGSYTTLTTGGEQ